MVTCNDVVCGGFASQPDLIREDVTVEREELRYLYYITAIVNVPSIVAHGILSHNQAAKLPHADIAMASVQDIRAQKRVPGGVLLHDYACLYFCARNPMLNKRCRTMRDELCVLAVDPAVVDLPGVAIASCNAAAGIAVFAPSPSGIAMIDRSRTFATWWTHDDPFDTDLHRKQMCAEALVPNLVEPRYLRGALVPNETAHAALKALGTGLKIQVLPSYFFDG